MTGLARPFLFDTLSPTAAQAVDRCVTERRFRAGALLLEGGARAEWLHVIRKGLVREYYVTADGDERTRVFVSEGGVTGSLLDLASGSPSVTWIQALEPTRTLAIRFADFNELAARYADMQTLARQHAEALAVRKTKREYEMLALPAAARLARWQAEHPDLDGRITRRLLASYLGITPVHLSRITARSRPKASAGRRETDEPQR